ncbi:cation diffusion facilitator family transporter [Actinomycetaceae bacterium MB13-C1-2]|nr:cation diffusion facilitator family transporter [Actinomycetaceae bacterium MB13-C1-2]
MQESRDLSRFAWLSIAAAIVTIALKTGAWALTGSVGLLSDAAESIVNLAAAIVALIALKTIVRPADSKYTYGRSKAEYFSAAVEGVMIFVAAAVIMFMSVERFIHPKPLEHIGAGLIVSLVAAVINGVVGFILLRAGRRYGSITLEADGKHLFTDVITSVGVLVGIGLVALTGWERLDPIVGFIVGVNIVVTGARLVSESVQGLMDHTLPEAENATLVSILQSHTTDKVQFHGLQTRIAGQGKYANVDALVPGDWTVAEGHRFIEQIESEMETALPGLVVVTHIEPIEDPESYRDIPVGEVPIPPMR